MKKNIGPIRDTAAIILAGGKGKRMGIALPKSLLPLGKKTIIEHVLATLHSLPVTRIVIVTPADDSLFRKLLGGNRYSFVKQASPLGTGHAVATALHRQKFSESNVLIIMADSSALFKPGTVRQFIRQCAPESAIGITLFPAFRNVTSVGRVYLDKQHRLLGYHLRGASSRRMGRPYIQGGYLFFRTQWLMSRIHT
ncbi:MAG TPA: hypothetical protein DIS62_05205, partial [Candidatus Kerfeldbacteria bacterium]|nr:hypothetical protein [Candidatus Kerfeldbacteria bacterium]